MKSRQKKNESKDRQRLGSRSHGSRPLWDFFPAVVHLEADPLSTSPRRSKVCMARYPAPVTEIRVDGNSCQQCVNRRPRLEGQGLPSLLTRSRKCLQYIIFALQDVMQLRVYSWPINKSKHALGHTVENPWTITKMTRRGIRPWPMYVTWHHRTEQCEGIGTHEFTL